MRVVWSLEKVVGKDWEKQVTLLTESVRRWDYVFPKDHKVLYLDEFSRERLETLGITKIFDEVNNLCYSKNSSINPKVFWASAKIRAMQEQRGPYILVDNDFFVKEDFVRYLDSKKVCFSFLEITRGLYPSHVDPKVRQLQLSFRLQNHAANTSFIYIPDTSSFNSTFTETSLEVMEALSRYEDIGSVYMLFAEQLLFYSILKHMRLDFQCLHRNMFNSFRNCWMEEEVSQGLFNLKSSESYFLHLGPGK